ncbi:MAG: PorV/PorQ family protein [Sphingobacteriales bacterium]|nr:MAG: PorV/PorQ family protein [Sphingobacteriales bacterium]
MRNLSTKAALVVCALGVTTQAFAGNRDRIGQSGASELLLNPWGQSTGVFGMNTANVKGVDALKTNIAGLSSVEKTEIGVAHTMYLSGSKIGINNLAIAQRLGNFGVIGANLMAFGFGEIPIQTVDNPEGGIGTFTPQFFNVQVGFSKEFSNAIKAGVAATFVNEQVSNIKAGGAAFEAGIQYTTGKRDNFHFGITLRNLGTTMRFSGNGFTIDAESPAARGERINQQFPTERFEMPTYLNFGAAYDFYLDEKRLQNADDKPKHRATVMAAFTSNSFQNDYLGAGVEYAFREMFMVRGGFRYERDIFDDAISSTFYTGFSAGATIQQKIGDNGPTFGIDYSYRPTVRPNNGTHTFSLRFMR